MSALLLLNFRQLLWNYRSIASVICAPFVIAYSCKHEPVLPEHEVSFATEVHPIIAAGCQHSGCHDTLSVDPPELTTYENIMEEGDVKPGKPHDSKLYEVLISNDPDDVMPRAPYSRLTDNQIQLIYIWIAQGAKNN